MSDYEPERGRRKRGAMYARKPGEPENTVKGVLLLALGYAEGMAFCRGTVEAFFTVFSPALAFWFVVGLLELVQKPSLNSGLDWLLSLCDMLLAPVISSYLASFWRREDRWLRYAVASMGCVWFVLLGMIFLALVIRLLFPFIVNAPAFMVVFPLCVGLYGLWLSWFVAKVGLGVTALQAASVVALTIFSKLALYVVVALLPPYYMPWRPLLDAVYKTVGGGL